MSQAWAGWRSRALDLGLLVAVAAGGVLGNANWSAQPRFDGAGYAILARAIATGQGYRALDHPDHPRHAHFPPGYPLALALVWKSLGESTVLAHALSAACAVLACAGAWLWFRRLYTPPTALMIGLALGLNWLWDRTGSAIQSEPLFLLLSQAAVIAHVSGRRHGSRIASTVLTGMSLGLALMTRWAALALVAAVVIDLTWQGQAKRSLGVVLITGVIALPWLAWTLFVVNSGGETAARLLNLEAGGVIARIGEQGLFYLERVPDAILGPYVEVATARGGLVRVVAVAFAVGVLAIVGVGLIALGRRRRAGRIALLISIATVGLLLFWPYTEAGRFLIPLVPCLLIGVVEGLAAVLRGVGWVRRPARSRHLAAWLILAACVPYSGYQLARGKARRGSGDEREFSLACRWILQNARRPGPVLARHPGDVYWRTGREALEVESSERPGFEDASPRAIAGLIRRYRAAYVVVDRGLYTNEPAGPLARFVRERPRVVRRVWPEGDSADRVVIYEILEPD